MSDTWLYGNVRNGVAPGLSTRSLTGLFYLRDTIPGSKKLLIDPTTGLPLRSTAFIDGGYDRQPDFTIGLTNTIRFKKLSVSFLVDIRKGGDVFNATEHFLTSRGLSNRTLDRDQPRGQGLDRLARVVVLVVYGPVDEFTPRQPRACQHPAGSFKGSESFTIERTLKTISDTGEAAGIKPPGHLPPRCARRRPAACRCR